MSTITCFGEVLWDVFPKHKKIGGAPLNVALRLQSFGIDAKIISRIGNDEDGEASLLYIKDNAIDTSTIQMDPALKTGCVNVTLDKTGSASYIIEQPVAWDKIELTKNVIATVKSSTAFIFGSLASRNEVTKNTLSSLLQYASYKVFDVNLRPPFYTIDLLLDLMNKADFIKCNNDELLEICVALDFNYREITKQLKFIAQQTKTKHICVTKGKEGAVLLYNNQLYHQKGYPIKVVDTVGAGDSFLAGLISRLLTNDNPREALNFACAVGALVAGKEGANSKLTDSEILDFIKVILNTND